MTRDALEALTNAIVGYLVSVVIFYLVAPLWGLTAPLSTSFGVSAMFFCVSAARSYVLRRVFRRFECKKR